MEDHELLKEQQILEDIDDYERYSYETMTRLQEIKQEINTSLKAVDKLKKGRTFQCPNCQKHVSIGVKFVELLLKETN